MKCYARWTNDKIKDISFRDQTMLQFGDSWDIVANLILLNPGSAVPKSNEIMDDMLVSKNLPFFRISDVNQYYYEFTIDPLMRNIVNCFSKMHKGGVIKIYNLFNLKNQDSKKAVFEYYQNIDNTHIHTDEDDIVYDDKKVIIATGESNLTNELMIELKKFILLANKNKLYALQKRDTREFAFIKTSINQDGLINSYHPSYTFAYGNKTICDELK